ncbi:MAG: DUF2867 domain-containing protein [Tabrizicola sp.]
MFRSIPAPKADEKCLPPRPWGGDGSGGQAAATAAPKPGFPSPSAENPFDTSATTICTDSLPRAPSLWSLHQPGDLLDCCWVPSTLTPREAATRSPAHPEWAAALLRLRNALVLPFGLKTGEPHAPIFATCLESDTELILGTDDRKLNFRIGPFRQDGGFHGLTGPPPRPPGPGRSAAGDALRQPHLARGRKADGHGALAIGFPNSQGPQSTH